MCSTTQDVSPTFCIHITYIYRIYNNIIIYKIHIDRKPVEKTQKRRVPGRAAQVVPLRHSRQNQGGAETISAQCLRRENFGPEIQQKKHSTKLKLIEILQSFPNSQISTWHSGDSGIQWHTVAYSHRGPGMGWSCRNRRGSLHQSIRCLSLTSFVVYSLVY